MSSQNRKKDIAVVGISGTFPKSRNVSILWNNLVAGKELGHFYDPKELDPNLANDPNFVPMWSFVEHAESFDYRFFGYTKEEASLMDPQIRIMHEQVYAALDNAGYAHKMEANSIGLYLTASDNLNWRILEMLNAKANVTKFLSKKFSNKEFISTLISYKLGLKGPSIYLNTACSGSLTTIHLACRALLLKECNIAVTGGVSIQSKEGKGYLYQEGMIDSKDGYCKAFDAESSGTVSGEGAGVVVLKRFEDAIRDKDYIYAVVKATAVNNDGKRKVGFTAPSVKGQSDCIKMAHKIAGIPPEAITYIEAHGTGTKLGDPIEIEALNEAFNFNTNHKCAVGSIKTNMGHLDAAAGVAGFIKTCLALNHKILPPSLHFKTPNPAINFKEGPFYVNADLKKWKSEEILRAGVSSFGVGGTNCHAVLEEFVPTANSTQANEYNLLLLSAKTKSALRNYKASLSSFLEQQSHLDANTFSHSINKKAQDFVYKDFMVFQNEEDLEKQLKANPKNLAPLKKRKNIVFLFPGQGTQYFEMAQELYHQIPYFQKIMDEGFGLLQELSGVDYKAIIGYEKKESNDPLLINDTLYTQPLLFLIECALAKTLIHFGIQPSCMIGHSLGEYAAACISNVFSLEDGLKIIFHRASLMNGMKPGAMIAIKASREAVLEWSKEDLSVAAINTSDTCVLAGEKEAVEALIPTLEEKGISYSVLKTSHAFHSYMMDDMLQPFQNKLAQVAFSKPEIPFISNLTGKEITSEDLSADYWAKHLRSTILFQEGLSELLEKCVPENSIFIEVGPGRTLLNFLKKRIPNAHLGLSMIRNAKEQKNDFNYFLNNLGALWNAGQKINTAPLYEEGIRKMPVPAYAFDSTKLPARVDSLELIQSSINVGEDKQAMLGGISTGAFFDDPSSDSSQEDAEAYDGFRASLTTAYLPPENETQTKLCAIWSRYLGEDKIGIEDDFFELGGDSLKAMSILNTIKAEFDCELDVKEFYDSLNIKNGSSKIEVILKLKKMSAKGTQKNKITI